MHSARVSMASPSPATACVSQPPSPRALTRDLHSASTSSPCACCRCSAHQASSSVARTRCLCSKNGHSRCLRCMASVPLELRFLLGHEGVIGPVEVLGHHADRLGLGLGFDGLVH